MFPLLQTHPNHPELLQLGILLYLDRKNITKARELLKQYVVLEGSKKFVKEIDISLYLLEENWKEVAPLLEDALAQEPANINYRRDYAFVLSQLSQWQESREQYEILMKEKNVKDELIWDYRQVLKEAANTVGVKYQYDHFPESLRQHKMTQTYRTWIHPRLRVQADMVEELYTKRALGATAATREWIIGHRLTGDWLVEDNLVISGYWQIDHFNSEDFHETDIRLDHKRKKVKTLVGYQYNHLVRSPLEGLNKKGREDYLYLRNDIALDKRWSLGQLTEVKWFRVEGSQNQINGKDSLGSKYIYDVFTNYTLFNKPYFAFNMHYKRAHWDKSFSTAEQVLDFIEDERIYYGGFYGESILSFWGKAFGSVTRSFDEKRNFYSTLSNVGLEIWPTDNLKALLSYDYGFNVAGTSGSGNSQQINFSLDWLF